MVIRSLASTPMPCNIVSFSFPFCGPSADPNMDPFHSRRYTVGKDARHYSNRATGIRFRSTQLAIEYHNLCHYYKKYHSTFIYS